MSEEMTITDYRRAHEEILKAVEENRQSFEMALLLHEQGFSNDKTKENVTKAAVLAWVVEHFKVYPADEKTKAEGI